MMRTGEFERVLEHSADPTKAAVTVAITCYKYGTLCIEALESVLAQTEKHINLVIVDDCSPDDSVRIILQWLDRREIKNRFEQVLLIRHLANQGLSISRNTAVANALTPYVFILDADNIIYPRALTVLREAIENSRCSMAYSLIEKFGEEVGLIGNSIWMPEKFAYGNYIDAMAMIKTEEILKLGGYRVLPNRFGWEDYDLWCSFVDQGLTGCHVPQILCRYRVAAGSMLRTQTNSYVRQNLELVRADFERHHAFKFFFQ